MEGEVRRTTEVDNAIDICNACEYSRSFVHKVFIIEGSLFHRYGNGSIETCSPCANSKCPKEKKIMKIVKDIQVEDHDRIKQKKTPKDPQDNTIK